MTQEQFLKARHIQDKISSEQCSISEIEKLKYRASKMNIFAKLKEFVHGRYVASDVCSGREYIILLDEDDLNVLADYKSDKILRLQKQLLEV